MDLGKFFEKKMFFLIMMLHVWKIAKNIPLHLESLGWTRSIGVVAVHRRPSNLVVPPLFLGAVLAVKVGVIRQISTGQWEIAVFAHLKKKHQISENRHRGQISGHKGQRSKVKVEISGCLLDLCQTGSPGERWPDCEHAECGAVEKIKHRLRF